MPLAVEDKTPLGTKGGMKYGEGRIARNGQLLPPGRVSSKRDEEECTPEQAETSTPWKTEEYREKKSALVGRERTILEEIGPDRHATWVASRMEIGHESGIGVFRGGFVVASPFDG